MNFFATERWRLAGWLGGVLAAGLLVLALWVRLGNIPPITPDTTPTIVDRNGIVLYEPLSPTGTRNEWLDDVPSPIANATIAGVTARQDVPRTTSATLAPHQHEHADGREQTPHPSSRRPGEGLHGPAGRQADLP